MSGELAPWLVVAGLGAFHGINPAMGWLFAVALGMHRGSGRVVAWATVPIALGHAASVLATLVAFLALGSVVELASLRRAAGLLLLGWSVWVFRRGHPRRVRVGMTAGFAGLFVWSFTMASAHGAGLMLLPALIPICFADASGTVPHLATTTTRAVLVVLVHGAAMVGATALVAFLVFRVLGIAVLRSAWINLDLLWAGALALTGLWLLVA
ncbi:MAG: hypothetical protein RMK73_09680 [Geminicoccaceae bacterium]|nr:hypothetical protein [Geminicoccaceae bacterium]MDW8341738.1 hypothetical protein [Geminicoccaceae bacterium]